MYTDTSDKVIGGVQVQEGDPIAFKGRKLHGAKLIYLTHEKEKLAIVHSLRAWRYYLLGSKFIVKMDNVANNYFQTQKKLSFK